MLRRPLASLASLAATVTALAAPPDGARTLTVEQAVALRSVSDVAISPTGDHIAYTLNVPRDADDEPGPRWSELWVIPVDAKGRGGEPRRYTPSKTNVSLPRWWPDGRSIAFVAKRDRSDADDENTAQIYRIPIDGGEAVAITEHETSISGFAVSPDGATVAFSAADPEPERPDGHDWLVTGDDSYKRLWTLAVEDGSTSELFGADLDVAAFEWCPDGSALVFTATEKPGVDEAMMRSALYRAPIDGTSPRRLAPTPGKLGAFRVSPDGTTVALLAAVSANDPLPQTPMLVPTEGGAARPLTEGLESSAFAVSWLDDDNLLVVANRGTQCGLSVVRRDDLDRQDLWNGPEILSSVHHVPGHAFLAAAASTTSNPTEVYTWTPGTSAFVRLTHHNPSLDAITLAEVETIEWKAADGTTIEGVVTHPLGAGATAPAPLVVNPHGGPEGVSQTGWNDLPQLLAARGYRVLQPNYRGSAGRGVAFSKGDHDDLGGQEFHDILAGVDHLVGAGLADPERVGIGGWSYGGYLSALAATHHGDRFRAAIMGAGISNWVSFTGTTDIPEEMSTVHWNRAMDTSENVALYWDRSPLSRVSEHSTPTLILFGAEDERVPPSQGAELHAALRTRGVPTEMVQYPRAEHGIRETAHRIDLYTRQLEWFDTHLQQ